MTPQEVATEDPREVVARAEKWLKDEEPVYTPTLVRDLLAALSDSLEREAAAKKEKQAAMRHAAFTAARDTYRDTIGRAEAAETQLAETRGKLDLIVAAVYGDDFWDRDDVRAILEEGETDQ